MWFFKIFRSFFFAIDSILFNFIPTVYSWIETISRISILSNGQIHNFANRIQLLLGVFMLFKVVLSLITYILNPDEFGDKGKGLGKLWLNIIFTLILLVVTPYFFNMAYDLQTMVLEDNTLANVLFGDQTDSSINSNFKNNAGQEIAYSVMIPFFTPATTNDNNTNYDLSECNNFVNEDGNFNENCLLAMAEETNDDEISFELAPFYFGLLPGAVYNIVTNVSDDVNENIIMVNNYATGVSKKNLGLTFRGDIARLTTDNGKDFVIDYKFGLSTVAAVVVILVLISFCLDVALRSVKLAFLQLIAPIPIISFIDPKQGKDGLFKKWYTMCFSTYISLFVRLLGLYFGVYLIGAVINSDGPFDIVTGKTVNNIWIKLMMIIGILMFVKQLPKILEGLGIKLEGGGKFTLNPFKKFEEEAAGGKQILGAAGGLVSGIADRGARIATAQGTANKLKAAAGGLIGIPGAAMRGFRDGKGFSSGMKAQNAVNRRLREGRIKGLSPAQSYLDYAGSLFGLDDATLEKESRINYQNETTLKDMKLRSAEASRAESLEATRLEHENAQRKETLQRLSDAKSKGDAVKSFSEEFTKKKANFGSNTTDVGYYAMASANYGNALAFDLNLSDGSTIAAGTLIDDSVLTRISKSANKDYTRTININNNNLDMLKQMKLGDKLAVGFEIGDRTFSAGDVVTSDMIEDARDAAYQYEKYAIKQVQNMFESDAVGSANSAFANDQREFNAKSSEYTTAVSNANESIHAYNKTYGTSIVDVSDSVTYDALDSAIKDYISGDTIKDMRTASAKIESKIAQHKQNAANAKDNITGHLLDENGNVIIDSATGLAKEYGIDEFESIHNPRQEETKRKKEQHTERRSTWQGFSNK